MKLRSLVALGVLLCAFAVVRSAQAESNYPNKVIRIISPVPAGGLSDIAMRPMTQELSKRLGQAVIIDNRPGAGGLVTGRNCANAAPDGYTICNAFNDVISNAEFLFKNVGYDPHKAFVPITNVYFIINGFVVSSSLGVSTLPELIALSKTRPEGINVASPATGITMFIQGVSQKTGAKFNIIPYKSGSEVANALLTKSVDAAAVGLGNMIPYIKAGTFKALSVDSERRFAQLPDVPTLKELGLADVRIKSWYGFVAPAGTPPDVIKLLHDNIVSIYNEPKIRDRVFNNLALEPILDTPEEFGKYLVLDRERTGEQARRMGVQPQ